MKKLLSLLLVTMIIFTGITNFVKAEDNSYKYLNKTIIKKLDKKIDSIKWNKSKTLILLISKVDKIIKNEDNEIKKALYSELNVYLKLKKKEIWNKIVVDGTADWKTYKNNRVWYSFDYPINKLFNWIDETIKYINNSIDSEDLVQFTIDKTTFWVRVYVWKYLDKEIESVINDSNERVIWYHDLNKYEKILVWWNIGYQIKWQWVVYVIKNWNLYVFDSHITTAPIKIEEDSFFIEWLKTVNFETKKLSKINETDTWKNVLFSKEQVNSILKKIDEWIDAQKEKAKNNSNILIQWNFKAEYIAPKDYKKDTDKIIVTVSWKKYELAGFYWEKERQKYLDSIKKWQCYRDWMLVEPSDWECGVSSKFGNFISFSPSWYYISYNVSWYENSGDRLVNIETWKNYLNICWYNQPNTWTNDKKQFIYWDGFWMGCVNWGLYITIKWDFPNVKKINDYETIGLYVDDIYIYTTILVSYDDITHAYNSKLLIYDYFSF